MRIVPAEAGKQERRRRNPRRTARLQLLACPFFGGLGCPDDQAAEFCSSPTFCPGWEHCPDEKDANQTRIPAIGLDRRGRLHARWDACRVRVVQKKEVENSCQYPYGLATSRLQTGAVGVSFACASDSAGADSCAVGASFPVSSSGAGAAVEGGFSTRS